MVFRIHSFELVHKRPKLEVKAFMYLHKIKNMHWKSVQWKCGAFVSSSIRHEFESNLAKLLETKV